MVHSNITTSNHINSKSEICYLQWTSTLNTRVSSLDSPLFALHWYSPAQCRVMLRITRVSPGRSVTVTISKICLQPHRKVGKGGGGLKQTTGEEGLVIRSVCCDWYWRIICLSLKNGYVGSTLVILSLVSLNATKSDDYFHFTTETVYNFLLLYVICIIHNKWVWRGENIARILKWKYVIQTVQTTCMYDNSKQRYAFRRWKQNDISFVIIILKNI